MAAQCHAFGVLMRGGESKVLLLCHLGFCLLGLQLDGTSSCVLHLIGVSGCILKSSRAAGWALWLRGGSSFTLNWEGLGPCSTVGQGHSRLLPEPGHRLCSVIQHGHRLCSMAGCFQRPYCKAAQGHCSGSLAMQGQTRNHINSWAGLLA